MPIVLAYWKIRALGQAIRYLLAYSGVEWVDKFYDLENEGQWYYEEKPKSSLPFPNLPYLIDGKVCTSQSNVILRYLGRKFGLMGKTEEETLRIELMEQQVVDYWNRIFFIFFSTSTTPQSMDTFRVTHAVDQMSAVSKFLADYEYFSGAGLSYVDFKMHEYLYIMSLFAPKGFAKFPNLSAFLTRIQGLPGVREFIASDRHIEWPITRPGPKWGNSISNPELDPKNRDKK